MIKKLRLKFVLVFLVLVVSVIITSSCYAVLNTTVKETPFTLESLYNDSNFTSKWYNNGFTLSLEEHDYKIFAISRPSVNDMCIFFIYTNYNEIAYIDTDANGKTIYFYNSDNQQVECNYYRGFLNSKGEIDGNISSSYNSIYNFNSDQIYVLDITELEVRVKGTVIHSPAVDTSFSYSLDGVKRGQVELKIENLDTSLNMYGYVDVKNTFEIGDTFISSTLSDYLRLIGMNSDNSDLSCSLYEGEKLLYYIVNEDNVILDIGYISELADGYFLYGFPVSDGVDFVFLNNGQVYWNNDLTFKYQINNASLLTKNEIVSSGNFSYIVSDKTSAKITYNGFVYDSTGVVISSATTFSTNNLSSLYMKEVNTGYFENNIGYNKSCYWLQSIILAGTDSSGNDIDFSNYSVRWSIPTWLTVDSIELGTASYDKYNGVITGFSSNGVLSIQLKIYELLKNHISDFDITLEIYNDHGDLVLTYLVNSDDIVKNQILNEENNIDKPSYDITDSPNYTGGSGNKDFSNIQNWTSDDYLNLMSTDNFIWEFFKAILGNLPWWITVPLTILIFGVVLITLIRFARGA